MAYDTLRGLTVLFGGYIISTGYHGGTWEYGPHPQADLDNDGYVNAGDVQIFAACATGPGIPYNPASLPTGCTLAPDAGGHIAADLNDDGFVDMSDFAGFQQSWSGLLPARPKCAD